MNITDSVNLSMIERVILLFFFFSLLKIEIIKLIFTQNIYIILMIHYLKFE